MSEMELKLRLTADGKGFKAEVVDAKGRIEELGKTGEQAGERTRKGMDSAGRGVDRLSRQVSQLKSYLVGFVGFQFAKGLVSQLAETADSAAGLAARIRLVTDSEQEFNRVQAELFAIAQRTRAPLQATTDLYARMGPALKSVTGSTEGALQVVETINQALATSGSTAAESSGALLQLSQALAAGALRGDEFNSVMEGAPGIMRAIAAGLDVPVGKLRQLANEGRLTAEVVVAALQKSRDAVENDFSQMPLTISGALQQVENRWLQLIGQMDQASGVSGQVAEAIATAADYMDEALAGVVLTANGVTGAIHGIAGAASLVIAGVLDLLDTLSFGLSDTLGNLTEAFRAAAESNFKSLAQDIDDANAAFRQLSGETRAAAESTRQAGEQVDNLKGEVEQAGQAAASTDLLPKVDAARLTEYETGLRNQVAALDRLRGAALAGGQAMQDLQALAQADNALRRTGIDLASSQAAAYRAVALALKLQQDALQQTASLAERENAAYQTRLNNLKTFFERGLIDQQSYQTQAQQLAADHQKRLAEIENSGRAVQAENERYAQRLALIQKAYQAEQLTAQQYQARLAQLETRHQERLAAIRRQYRQADSDAYQQYLAGLIAAEEQAYQARLQGLNLLLEQGRILESQYRAQVEELERRHTANLEQIRQNALSQYLAQLDQQALAAEQSAGLRTQAAENASRAEVNAAVQAAQGVSDAALQAAGNVESAFAQGAQGASQALISIAQTAENAFAQVQVNVGQTVNAVQQGFQQSASQAVSYGQSIAATLNNLYKDLANWSIAGQTFSSNQFQLPNGTTFVAQDLYNLIFGGEDQILKNINNIRAVLDGSQPLQKIFPFGPGWDLLQQYREKKLPFDIIAGGRNLAQVGLTSEEFERVLHFTDALDRARKIQQQLNDVSRQYPADIAAEISQALQDELDSLIEKFPDIRKALDDTLGAGKIELPKLEVPKIEVPKIEAPKIELPKPESTERTCGCPAPIPWQPAEPMQPVGSPLRRGRPADANTSPHRAMLDDINKRYLPDAAKLWKQDAGNRVKANEKADKRINRERLDALQDAQDRERDQTSRHLDEMTRRFRENTDQWADIWSSLQDRMASDARKSADAWMSAWSGTLQQLTDDAASFADTLSSIQVPAPAAAGGATAQRQAGGGGGGGMFSHTAVPAPGTGSIVRDTRSDTFWGAPRFHTGGVVGVDRGLAPDEVPAILQKGEVVLTPAQARLLAPARPMTVKPAVTVNVHNHAGVQVDVSQSTTPQGLQIDIDVLAESVEAEIARRMAEGRGLARVANPFGTGTFA